MLHHIYTSMAPMLGAWLVALLALCVLLTVIRAVLRSTWAKGQRGEWRVRRMLRWHLDSAVYVALHNVTLATREGSTQIDHVVISPFGIFVIETKNLQGTIVGSERQPQWTQQIHQRSFLFQNPLHQNYQHTQTLQALLQVPPPVVHSVIAFVGRSRLPTGLPAHVTQGNGCVHFIRSFTQPVLTTEQVQRLVQQLQARRLAPTRATHRAHVQHLQKRHPQHAKAPIQAPRPCHQCGSAMVLRTTTAGARPGQPFWGCSTFPQCRAVQPAGAQG